MDEEKKEAAAGGGEGEDVDEEKGYEEADNDDDEEEEDLPVADYTDLSSLPKELRKKLVVLRGSELGRRGRAWGDVVLVGTVHISRQSCQEVAEVIRHVQPDIIMLELCASRQWVVHVVQEVSPPLGLRELGRSFMHGGLFATIYSWATKRAAGSLEVYPGAEFAAAWKEGGKVGAQACFGDRPVEITVKRLWLGLSPWQRIKLLFTFMRGGFDLPSPERLTKLVEEMKQTDALTEVMRALGKEYPTLLTTLISERDLYMTVKLQECLSSSDSKGYPLRVVGVVGAGHLSGIRKAWTRRNIDVAKLLEVPGENVSIGDDDDDDDEEGGEKETGGGEVEVLDLRALMRRRRRKWRRVWRRVGVCAAGLVLMGGLALWILPHSRKPFRRRS